MNKENETKESLKFESKTNLDLEDNDVINRCYFCNKEQSEEIHLKQSELYRRGQDTPSKYNICSEKHDRRVKQFFRFADNFYVIFLLFILLIPVVLIALTIFLNSLVFVFGIFMSIGLGLIILPLIGNQIIDRAGLKLSNIIGRVLGAVLLGIGLVLLFTNGLKFITN